VRQIAIVVDGDDTTVRDVLAERSAMLHDQAGRVEALLGQLIQGGVRRKGTMMKTAANFRLVTVNIGVDSETELETARGFWGKVLGTELEDWGTGSQQVVLGHGDNIGFLNIRVRAPRESHRGHISAFGLGVPGLDDTHQRAIAAGATVQSPPTDGEHMPRHSLIVDPVGNRVVFWESGK